MLQRPSRQRLSSGAAGLRNAYEQRRLAYSDCLVLEGIPSGTEQR